MIRTVDILAPPAVEPVTLAEAKLHCRVEIDDDDDLITGLISSARTVCEAMTNRAFITQTLSLSLDSFPAGGGYFNRAIRQNPGLGNYLPTNGGRIILPRGPVQSVSSVVYLDTLGHVQTVSPSTYRLIPSQLKPGHLINATNQIWPITFPTESSVTITSVHGYGDTGAAVPAGIKSAMKLLISHWYNNRDAVAEGSFAAVPMTVDALLAPFDTGSY